MKALQWRWVLVVLVLVGVLAGCGTGASGGEASGEVTFKITGTVDTEMGWTEAEVRAMDTIEAEYTDKEGETKTYTGVSVSALLDKAGVKGSTVAFVADDGYTAEVTVDEVTDCADCIVSFREQGGFSMVMPGFSGKLQVKGVVEIQVK